MSVPNNETKNETTSAAPLTGSVATVEKAIDLLFHLHAAGEPLGVSGLGRALGLPKSTAHRLLVPLVRRGLVERDGSGRYQPGFALVALGLGVLRGDPLVAAARPVLEEEARVLGETVFLTAARGGRITVLEKAEGRGFLRAAPQVGSEVPIHATAVGKLQLAFAPDEVTPDAPLEPFTPATPVTRERLEREVERARLRGYAENRDEWIPGLAVVAAPVLLAGRLVAAVAIALPSARLRELAAEALARRAVAAAGRVAARLSGTRLAAGPPAQEEVA
jgi:DNA-binding IclR family transcriptional regulator